MLDKKTKTTENKQLHHSILLSVSAIAKEGKKKDQKINAFVHTSTCAFSGMYA